MFARERLGLDDHLPVRVGPHYAMSDVFVEMLDVLLNAG